MLVEDELNVNIRRANVELELLEVYAKQFGIDMVPVIKIFFHDKETICYNFSYVIQ